VNKLNEILKTYWGYESFRPLQEEIIQSVFSGKDTLGLMPTGDGKSLTFQVPTLLMDGLCLAVTPLVALMKDQVDALKTRQIKAAYIHSGMSRHEILTTLDNCIYGHYKFLYVSPERLTTELFLAKLPHLNVCLLAVDESHCISQWGYDFRPSYMKIADIRHHLPNIPVLALTATATPDVIDDIQDKLLFRQKNVLQKNFERKNIIYVVRDTEDKIFEIIRILKRVPGCAIIYVRSRKRTKEIAIELQRQGFSAEFFHAGLTSDEKIKKQNAWKSDECRIIVCTNAFGMGIDKPDVRLVIHFELPGSLEEYFQESGRAGRDGLKAYAVALHTRRDEGTLKRRISEEYPERKFIKDIYEKLAYFYQIPMGSGGETGHNFHLKQFCAAYHYNITQVFNALKILDLSGYIEYVEESDKQSRLMIVAHKDELYGYTHLSKEADSLLQALLRSYTGLFSDYVHINEELIGQRAELPSTQVYEILKMLSHQNIVNYIPQQRVPVIYYVRDRVEIRHLVIPKSVYEQRRDRFANRIAKVIEYGGTQTRCRSKTLLRYFGAKNASDCGVCDVCIGKRRKEGDLSNMSKIISTVKQLVKEKERPIEEITDSTEYSDRQIINAIRFLADNGQVEVKGTLITYKQR
jgi:ATP-dependent DNA helicase RecQ